MRVWVPDYTSMKYRTRSWRPSGNMLSTTGSGKPPTLSPRLFRTFCRRNSGRNFYANIRKNAGESGKVFNRYLSTQPSSLFRRRKPLWIDTLRFLPPSAPTPIPRITRNTGEKDQKTGMFPHHQGILATIPRMRPVPDMDIHLKEIGNDHLGKGEIIWGIWETRTGNHPKLRKG